MRQSGLTLLLPHQYQGQGPEHSSARVERFLQSCDEDPDEVPDMNESTTRQIQNHNWQIVNCTTPANYFHVLRRQIHRDFRKPLVVIAPKGLLRLNDCTSSFDEMSEGTLKKRKVEISVVWIQPSPYYSCNYCYNIFFVVHLSFNVFSCNHIFQINPNSITNILFFSVISLLHCSCVVF